MKAMRFKIPSQRAELMELLESSSRLKSLYAALMERGSDGDSAHDFAHLLRVALWTCKILVAEDHKTSLVADPLLEQAVAAALLHDLVNVPKNHPDRAKASQFSAEAAVPLLERAHFSPDEVQRVAIAIRQHSFSRGETPESSLGKALQDADRLEALGAIGIMRTYSTGVRMGTRYFHPEDPWAQSRKLDDSAFSLDHFFTKLLRLPDTMNTAAGREEALERVRPMQAFLDSLARELGEKRPSELGEQT